MQESAMPRSALPRDQAVSFTRKLRDTMLLRGFGLLKVPMIAFVSPTVEMLDDTTCAVRLPLTWRTRNHFRTMYFGAMAVGADCCGGLLAVHHIRQAGHKGAMSLLFKSFHAEFLRRPDDDVIFICDAGEMVRQAVAQSEASGERVNQPLPIRAVLAGDQEQVVAEFELTLSVKIKAKR